LQAFCWKYSCYWKIGEYRFALEWSALTASSEKKRKKWPAAENGLQADRYWLTV